LELFNAQSSVVLHGVALHQGGLVSVELSRTVSPAPHPDAHRAPALPAIVWAQRGAEALAQDLVVARTDRGVTVRSRDGRIEIDLVEHLLAAIGGLGVRGGLRISTSAAELPLLDGGARRFAEALIAIGAPMPSGRTGADDFAASSLPVPDLAAPGDRAPALRVVVDATLRHGMSSYRFARDPGKKLRVHVRFPPPVGDEHAAWDGDPTDFLERIAPARTFGWVAEHAGLLATGRARGLSRAVASGTTPLQHIDPDSLIVFDAGGCLPGSRPNEPGEVARHKLLDLIGDLSLYGGPPHGRIDAFAPGHTATHRIVREALDAGILRVAP
jgi:UDP-3-O-[3-hydroxymyristoyl] N-acetylglucosamine deacetylase